MKRNIVGDHYKYVEIEIQRVPLYRKEIEEEKEGIAYHVFSPRQAWDEEKVVAGGKDKIYSAVVEIMESPIIGLMQETIDAVEATLLKYPDLKPLCELYFWAGKGRKEVSEKLEISRATFFNRKDQLIRAVAKNLRIRLDSPKEDLCLD